MKGSMKRQSNSEDHITIRFEDREGYLYAFFSGRRDNLADAIKFWRRAVDECHKRAYKRLLVEQYFPIPLSTADTYYLAAAISKMPVTRLKIAFVDRDLEQNDINMFAGTVAGNRGVVGRIFTNMSDAEKYLTSKPHKE
jgi:hypothetical protein